jgi:hypothetical protein
MSRRVIVVPDGARACDLAEAAEAGDTLVFEEGTYELPRPLHLRRDLQIEGRGAQRTQLTVAAGRRHVIVEGAVGAAVGVSIRGLTLSGARVDGEGAALVAEHAFVSLQDVRLHDNRVPDRPDTSGGALALLRCDAVLAECVFLDNGAPTGGAIVARESTLRLANCHFEGNQAESVVDILAFASELNAIHCTFGRTPASTPFYEGGGQRGARVVLVSPPFSAIDARVLSCLFIGAMTPLAAEHPGLVALDVRGNCFDPSAAEAIAALSLSDVEKRERLLAGADDSVRVDGVPLSQFFNHLSLAGNIVSDNHFATVELAELPEWAIHAQPPPDFVGRGRAMAPTLARPSRDLVGRERPEPATIGCVELE